jgi:hypothetical protein
MISPPHALGWHILAVEVSDRRGSSPHGVQEAEKAEGKGQGTRYNLQSHASPGTYFLLLDATS